MAQLPLELAPSCPLHFLQRLICVLAGATDIMDLFPAEIPIPHTLSLALRMYTLGAPRHWVSREPAAQLLSQVPAWSYTGPRCTRKCTRLLQRTAFQLHQQPAVFLSTQQVPGFDTSLWMASSRSQREYHQWGISVTLPPSGSQCSAISIKISGSQPSRRDGSSLGLHLSLRGGGCPLYLPLLCSLAFLLTLTSQFPVTPVLS